MSFPLHMTDYRVVPISWRAFIVFSLLVSPFSFVSFWHPELKATMAPYTGSSSLIVYVFALILVMVGILNSKARPVKGVVVLLMAAALFRLFDTIRHTWWPTEHIGNPYLAYHPIRPLITVGLPLFWLLVLRSSDVVEWVSRRRGAKR